MDFGKGAALHRLYGHSQFVREAKRKNKDQRFIDGVCTNLKCTGKSEADTWRDYIIPRGSSYMHYK